MLQRGADVLVVEHSLRSKLTAVRAELVETKSAFLKELEALRDELEETQQRLAEAERQATTRTEADDDSEDLPARLQKAE
jgi:Tfp pilus assembly protein PilO